ncbi:hypothetical protein CIB84_009842, partial [Bambusicola thoracicus]
GPCRREMEDTLNHLKILNVLSPRGFHIPNCDKKGFYKKKQVSATFCFSVVHPKAEKEVIAGVWINMDNRFQDMMAREKEMSTAITWEASEG